MTLLVRCTMSLVTMVGLFLKFLIRIVLIAAIGTPPAQFRALAREQILRYPTAHIKNATVLSIKSIGDGTVSAFNVSDNTGNHYTSRKLVLGTGVSDVLPNTPGVKEVWGKGLFWCPWCDGYGKRVFFRYNS